MNTSRRTVVASLLTAVWIVGVCTFSRPAHASSVAPLPASGGGCTARYLSKMEYWLATAEADQRHQKDYLAFYVFATAKAHAADPEAYLGPNSSDNSDFAFSVQALSGTSKIAPVSLDAVALIIRQLRSKPTSSYPFTVLMNEPALFVNTADAILATSELVQAGSVTSADAARVLVALNKYMAKSQSKWKRLIAGFEKDILHTDKLIVTATRIVKECQAAVRIPELACPAVASADVRNLRSATAAPCPVPNSPTTKSAPATTVALAVSLPLVGPRLLQRGENGPYYKYRYSATSAGFTLTNSPTDIRDVQWDFGGVPSALTPGTEFTITVKGKLTGSPGVEVGANYSGGVTASGLTVLKQQNGYFYQGAQSDGTFTYRVPIGTTKATVELWGDWGISTFAIYCYGACT